MAENVAAGGQGQKKKGMGNLSCMQIGFT